MQAASQSQALPELAAVPWRQPTDARWLRRWGRIWHAWTLLYTVPFIAAAVGMVWLEPLALPVALAALAHAWIIPELYAFRGASVARPKVRHAAVGQAAGGVRCAATAFPGEPVAQGLLGDLLGHHERELQRTTGLALERGALGVWLVGEGGALLLTPGGRRVHCFCVAATDPELPPSDRIAHLLLALRVDEEGFATVANHAFAGAPWRVRRRLPKRMRPALDAARLAAQ
ncbi:MAG TPA: hypothetical protein VH683_07630 [Thermoleophilaceae bacterium]